MDDLVCLELETDGRKAVNERLAARSIKMAVACRQGVGTSAGGATREATRRPATGLGLCAAEQDGTTPLLPTIPAIRGLFHEVVRRCVPLCHHGYQFLPIKRVLLHARQ
jgi:hypothetical protein